MPGAVAPRVGVHRLKPGGSLRALGFLGGGLGVLPAKNKPTVPSAGWFVPGQICFGVMF